MRTGTRITGEALALALCALAVVGCSEEQPRPDCPASAAFAIVVRAVDGPLPRRTDIVVSHSGGTETYQLDGPDNSEVVLCTKLTVDAGTDAGGDQDVLSVSCDLWTRSQTKVTVDAQGYPPLEKDLDVTTDHGCIQTQSVELLLDPGDGSQADE